MRRLVDCLEQHACRQPDKVALICGTETLTYAQLWHQVGQRALELVSERFLLISPSSFLISYLASHLSGCVAVPVERNLPELRRQAIAELLTASDWPADTADILFTTGTTGHSKGVVISHRAILADAENLVEGLGFTSDITFVIHGPVNHIGSLSKMWPVLLLGGTLHIIDGLKDTDVFYQAFAPEGHYATFFVPANIRYLLSFDSRRFASLADRLDFIESGGAPLSHADMLQLCQLLPSTRLYNTYASTESGIIATYNFNNGRCVPGCLGRPMSHSRIQITPEGLIACQGETLMSGYVGDPELTDTVLRDGTLYMSDRGTIDAEGMLHIGGRDSEVINVGGYKVAPTEIEDAALAIPGVRDCICIEASHPIVGRTLKLLVVMADGYSFNKRLIARTLARSLESYKVPLLYEQVDVIARTYNGKLNRKHYLP